MNLSSRRADIKKVRENVKLRKRSSFMKWFPKCIKAYYLILKLINSNFYCGVCCGYGRLEGRGHITNYIHVFLTRSMYKIDRRGGGSKNRSLSLYPKIFAHIFIDLYESYSWTNIAKPNWLKCFEETHAYCGVTKA